MKILLTSCFCDYFERDGREAPSVIIRRGGLLDTVKSIWKNNARVLVIASDPDDHRGNDEMARRMLDTFLMSGLSVSSLLVCDGRNTAAADNLSEVDILFLSGGHVPTENRFMKRLGLRERLADFDGSVLALSAGSMNCADTVYAIPELNGEATDPRYERWIEGLGLTDINIFPHYQYLKGLRLDGLLMGEDIAFPDSVGREIIALTDGSYILLADGEKTLHGEAYLIKDGVEYPLTREGETMRL
ncbi:MAG: Type 1 glutamine amidotransferase-like domain-containing protein [Clostridia bacterium]|nr:Type 1 glutamine amidotransferase-like domain-containing protein [Clostridia bacterium]